MSARTRAVHFRWSGTSHLRAICLVLFLAAPCVGCGGKENYSGACRTDAPEDLARFVGTWECQDTRTSCESFSTPACSTETGTDLLTFTANMDAGTLSMISTLACVVPGDNGNPGECIDEFCAAGGGATMVATGTGDGSRVDGTFVIAGDGASLRRNVVIRWKTTFSYSGTCTRLDSGAPGPVGSFCDSSSPSYSLEQAEYDIGNADTNESCSAGASNCGASDCCFIPVGNATQGLCVGR